MRKLTPLAVIACLSLVLIAVKPGYSEKEAPKEQKAKAVKKASVRNRLPIFFGKLGLSNEQRGKVYGIQKKFRPQIRELEEQIQKLKETRSIEISGVLTETQSQQLAQFQKLAKERREQRKANRAKAKKSSKKSKKKTKASDDS